MRQQLSANSLAIQLSEICRHAAREILRIYNQSEAQGGIAVSHKADSSPVTLADLAAHHAIVGALHALTPNIPIVSEEDEASHAHRSPHGEFWLIDPLDGTKEFIARNGEFTANIALVRDGYPILGAVYAPVLDELFIGVVAEGAFRIRAGVRESITVASRATGQPLRVVASKSHLNAETLAFIERLGAHTLVQAGSSLKFCRVAEGSADVYPRLGPTCEWDTAAAQAVVEAAGGFVQSLDGKRLHYGKSVNLNPNFVVGAVAWKSPQST